MGFGTERKAKRSQDVLWSAQEDVQLQGRLHRQGQKKQVLVYRLVAWNPPDIYLNNISFQKEKMMDLFTEKGDEALGK